MEITPFPATGSGRKGLGSGKRAEKFPRVVIDGATALVVADIKAPVRSRAANCCEPLVNPASSGNWRAYASETS